MQRIFTGFLPAEIAERKAAGQKLRLLFYAHGGLTDERSGLEPVLARLKFWRQNNIYPISFVWETGLRETVTDILRGLTGAREVAARGIGEDLADAVLEVAGRPGGKRVWGQMKRSAEVAVLEGGGGAFVAQRTRDLWNAHHADLEIHAAGHSAGTIFHAQFLPALLGLRASAGAPPLRVKTLHFLAPACTTAIFNSKLKSLIGPNKGIDAFVTYTMNKSLEQDDTAGPYRKSLLLPRQPRVRTGAADPNPRARGEHPAGRRPDSILRPRRQPEAGRPGVLEDRPRRAPAGAIDGHPSRRLR